MIRARPTISSIDDADAVLADRAHAQLGLEGHAELAHDDHVERGAERSGDLGGDRHPAAGQPSTTTLAAQMTSRAARRRFQPRIETIGEDLQLAQPPDHNPWSADDAEDARADGPHDGVSQA